MDVRYRGQGYELNVPYTGKMIEAFRREHERIRLRLSGAEVELVTLRLRATIKSPQPPMRGIESRGFETLPANGRGRAPSARFFGRKKLAARSIRVKKCWPAKNSGPAIVTEYSATTVVPPGTKFGLDQTGNLISLGE